MVSNKALNINLTSHFVYPGKNTIITKVYLVFCSVDTLLQVHALHNLIDVLPFTSENADELISVHRPALDQLEAKYMANCSLLVS